MGAASNGQTDIRAKGQYENLKGKVSRKIDWIKDQEVGV